MLKKAPRRVKRLSAEDLKNVHDMEAERRYQEEMADTSKLFTKAAIWEWNQWRMQEN